MKKTILSVTQVNKYIKNLIEKDIFLNDIFVQGEISNFKAHTSGHLYFTLKDRDSVISAVMYKGNVQMLKFIPEDGMKVTVYGYVSLYERSGLYQIYVRAMEPCGKGALTVAFEQIKERLEKEGLFDLKYKKKIPAYPKCAAVITSPTGAAVRDIIKIAERRNKNIDIVVVPSLVQGKEAADDIVRAIKLVNEWKKADVIILGRGGGSIEDLWCFNEERVARAVFNSKIPIVSAIGHETDFTITDFTADLRASTPSAAAELIFYKSEDLYLDIKRSLNYIENKLFQKLFENNNYLNKLVRREALSNPFERLGQMNEKVLALKQKLNREIDFNFEKKHIGLGTYISQLEAISPLNTLKRGYTLTYDENKNIISDISKIKNGANLITILKNGYLKSTVFEKGVQNGKEEKF